MSAGNEWLAVSSVEGTIEDLLQQQGEVFQVFDKQDSGCISYGVRTGEKKWFVKYSGSPRSIAFMKNAQNINRQVRHPVLPKCYHSFQTGEGFALVYEWVEGEVLGSPDFPGAAGRNLPHSPHYRFRQLPQPKIIETLNSVFELHACLEQAGFVAEDFYDGSMIYDFDTGKVHVCDIDQYHEGPFILDRERCFGSSRFMAPEEVVQGSVIDGRTNVFTMGSGAFVFLGDGERSPASWRASKALLEVASKAVSHDRSTRYGSVKEFFDAWQKALHADQ